MVLATIPAGIIGIVFSVAFDLDQLFFDNIWLLSIAFLITAGVLLFVEHRAKKTELNRPINAKTAFMMGCGQAFGVLPGISRSGSTLSSGILAKVDRDSNASFTFLMSIPIILAAVLMEGLDVVKSGTIGNVNWISLAFGIVTSAVCGYIAVKFMLKIIKKANYKWFSIYLVGMSIATLITALM